MANQFIETTLMDGFADGPHITEVQTGIANQGLYGPDDYVLEGGRSAEAQILTNNSIRIFDAVFVIQGRRDVMAANDYADVTIANGAQGMNRNDIIVRRYEKDESSEVEKTSFAVIKGTASSGTASDPVIPTGDIRSGATLHNMALYRVKLQGLNIVAVEPLFKLLCNMSKLQKQLGELSQKGAKVISKDEFGIVIDTGHSHVRFGTSVRPTAKDGTGNRYVRLWSAAEIANLLKVPKIEAHNFDLSIRNGDSTSNPVHFYTPEYWNDGNFYAYTWMGSDGNVRVDYRMEYPTIGL